MWNCVSVSLTDMVVDPYRVSRWLAERVVRAWVRAGPMSSYHISHSMRSDSFAVRAHGYFQQA